MRTGFDLGPKGSEGLQQEDRRVDSKDHREGILDRDCLC